MKHVVVEGTNAINGTSAIQRYAHALVGELGRQPTKRTFTFLYLFENRRSLPRPKIENRAHREVTSRLPARLLLPIMRFTGSPKVEYLTGRSCDLVHFTGGLQAAPTRAPVVVTTLHGFLPIKFPQLVAQHETDRLRRNYEACVRRGTHFITVSEASKRDLMALYGVAEEHIRAIPLGVSPEFTTSSPTGGTTEGIREGLGLPAGRVALFVGTLEPHKNIRTIIRSFAMFQRDATTAWCLVLVGRRSGHVAAYEREIAELGMRDRVVFVDYQAPGSSLLPDLYRLADLLVFPSFYEGWASPPLEAMASGTPAVVSDIAPLRESTGGAALYVDPHDPADVAEKMGRLAEDPALYESQRRAGEAFAARFTWERCARETLAYYEELL